jgi:hypothetical protein
MQSAPLLHPPACEILRLNPGRPERTNTGRTGLPGAGFCFAWAKREPGHRAARRSKLVRSRRVADRGLGARTRPKAAAWRRACRAEQGPGPAERDACRRTKAGRHGGAGTSKPSSPARHAAETCAGLVSSGPSEISCAGGIALAARGCFAKSSSVRSGRRWKTVTRCSPLLILYRTEGSHEALSLAA